MAVPTAITDLSSTAASNSPSGSENVFPSLDDYLRAGFKFSRDLYDGALTLSNKTLASPVGTGVYSNALGAAALPSYTFTGDLNTGGWSPGADTLAWSTGGNEAMRIDSSQNVGVGTTTPSTAGKLCVVAATGTILFAAVGQPTSAHVRMSYTGVVDWDFKVNSAGSLTLGMGSERVRWDISGNYIMNNTLLVPGTPSGGGALYVESGALKYKGSSGTVTVIAPA